MARLGVARALAFAAYKDFLTLWKDADRNIPIINEAKAEYAKLQYQGLCATSSWTPNPFRKRVPKGTEESRARHGSAGKRKQRRQSPL